jgi:hypothetical protein
MTPHRVRDGDGTRAAGVAALQAVTRWVLVLVAMALLVSCASAPDPVATFVTADGPQYFLRPVAFQGPHGEADLDMTIRGAEEPVLVNFSLPLAAAAGLSSAELVDDDGVVFPLIEPERFFARSDIARYGSTMTRTAFDALRSPPRPVTLVITSRAAIPADSRAEEASAEHRFASARPWVRRMETLNLILAD